MLVEHSKNSYTTGLRLVVYKFFSCSTNIPRGLSAYNPQKLVVYCLIILLQTSLSQNKVTLKLKSLALELTCIKCCARNQQFRMPGSLLFKSSFNNVVTSEQRSFTDLVFQYYYYHYCHAIPAVHNKWPASSLVSGMNLRSKSQ